MARPAMYSPDISQHTPHLYRIAAHYGVPMTVLADRLIRHGLKNLSDALPERPVLDPSVVDLSSVHNLSPAGNTVPRKTA